MQQIPSDDNAALMDGALKLLHVPNDNDSKAQAKDYIRYVVETFSGGLEEKKTPAPRLKWLNQQTERIAASAGELARLLDETAPYFARGAAGYLGDDDWRDDQEIPHLSEILNQRELADFSARVQRLASIAARLHTAMPADRGGQSNLSVLFNAPPEWTLAVHCWELFTWFRPGKATGHLDGDYHVFTETVYNLATGKEPLTSLSRFIKKAARRCNAFVAQKPGFERLRRASWPRGWPFILNEVRTAARMYGAPNRLLDKPTKRQD